VDIINKSLKLRIINYKQNYRIKSRSSNHNPIMDLLIIIKTHLNKVPYQKISIMSKNNKRPIKNLIINYNNKN